MKKTILLAVPIVFVVIMLCLAQIFGTDGSTDESDAMSTEQSVSSETIGDDINAAEVDGSQLINEHGKFTFTAEQFGERFSDTLPKGFQFAKEIFASESQEQKMQLNILDASGEVTDMAILMDVKDAELPFKKMALMIKEDWFEDDVNAILNWYITTFFDGFDEKEKFEIHEEYLKMFTERSEEYRVYDSESCEVMMIKNVEDHGKIYYIMIAISY